VRNLAAGNIRIDRDAMRVHRGGREIRLTATEFRLLECLVGRAGHILSRAQLRDFVWGHANVSERTIDVNIRRLRRALSRAHESNPIRTVQHFGYSFDEADRFE
jgi:two-component system phosphate regulon response regulator PhoB